MDTHFPTNNSYTLLTHLHSFAPRLQNLIGFLAKALLSSLPNSELTLQSMLMPLFTRLRLLPYPLTEHKQPRARQIKQVVKIPVIPLQYIVDPLMTWTQ